jgi:exopolysaccharide biosynthesis protein
MCKKNWWIGSVILLIYISGCGTNDHSSNQESAGNNDRIYSLQVKTDSLFNSPQNICLLSLSKKSLNKEYFINIGYYKVDLVQTSRIAQNKEAVAAINGGFFNRKEGGGVSYFEMGDSVIHRPGDAGGIVDSIINGAILLTKNKILEIEAANTTRYYEESGEETFVIFTGPLLISDSKLQRLPDIGFTHKRHPRTCVGITKDSILFVTIDGRAEQADGMSLYELQKYMKDLGCIDAINLDGGGSTTMWTKEKGIVNNPSDKSGERPVANALLILKNVKSGQ